ncbi:dihydrofolate reductase [Sodiomyces alkalinus F11]|uniref:Dihydrofolate reductase n=1 Tax=Sodiomyces alkalinus (strain CBS 110278 / VKM F-3762 / F11) TaxID=1314773 RepID=A0A3N2Q331_SODAK|nr:dihydrofolate reductase [Sodiomyces alkalinus F11]ROT41025.1 dihydrofolate reductase [Sodiomyces alkalinus F11]
MASIDPNGVRERDPPARNNSKASNKKDFKILMLHGYTQSGPLFRSKTRALEKLLAKALSPLNITLTCLYPTAPLRLNARDIPGYVPPGSGSGDDDDSSRHHPAEETDPDAWAWFRRRDGPGPDPEITYAGIDDGMRALASTIRDAGGVDGVVGFSQGGAMAALVASALDDAPHGDRVPPAPHAGWAAALRDANGDRPLRFAAVYSGFFATDPSLAWCYDPPIRTPTVHFLGSLDTVVEEGRSRALIDRCVDPVVVVHPGGHYVPISKEWAMALAGFVKQYAQDETKAAL